MFSFYCCRSVQNLPICACSTKKHRSKQTEKHAVFAQFNSLSIVLNCFLEFAHSESLLRERAGKHQVTSVPKTLRMSPSSLHFQRGQQTDTNKLRRKKERHREIQGHNVRNSYIMLHHSTAEFSILIGQQNNVVISIV